MESTGNPANGAADDRPPSESDRGTLSNLIIGRHADGTEEVWEVRSLGGGVSVIGNRDIGYTLNRKAGERVIPLVGDTMNRAYGNAAMGLLYERDVDALFNPPRGFTPVREPKAGQVYFIGGDVGAVKIGFAARPEFRVKDLQCGSPIPLRVLATVAGMPALEREYHKRFATHRLHGEWFNRCPEIEAEIERLRPNPVTMTDKGE